MKESRVLGLFRGDGNLHRYEPVSDKDVQDQGPPRSDTQKHGRHHSIRGPLYTVGIMAIFAVLVFLFRLPSGLNHISGSCDSVNDGFICQPEISHFWGQYSPFFSVPSEISPDLPGQCHVTFAQVLSRHGARDPTAGGTLMYKELIQRIHDKTESYSTDFQFLKAYAVTLGSDQLTKFGQQELVNSGINFYERYKALTREQAPFVRASGQDRVVESAQNWTQGFHNAWMHDEGSDSVDTYPYPILQIEESNASNNTLSIELCKNFNTQTEYAAQSAWISNFAPPITARVNSNLKGANLSYKDTIHFMDLCPFETVASDTGKLSSFCSLFTEEEWKDYDYYQSVGKYYGYSWGNPLAPPQGIGFTNELIARLTNSPVEDHTSTNSTLDHDNATFPLARTLYADFSHDNDMEMIFAALGLYNDTMPLCNTTRETLQDSNGFSAAATVPFAARTYFEKLNCEGEDEELVRVIMNDRVLPLNACGGDELGRCRLTDFVESLSYAISGGDWEKCFE